MTQPKLPRLGMPSMIALAALASALPALCAGTERRSDVNGQDSAATFRIATAGTNPFVNPKPGQATNHNSSRSNGPPQQGNFIIPPNCTRDWKKGPFPGRTVTLSQGAFSESKVTNASGAAEFPYVSAGTYAMTITTVDGTTQTYVVGTSQDITCVRAANDTRLDCTVSIERPTRAFVHVTNYACRPPEVGRSSPTPKPKS